MSEAPAGNLTISGSDITNSNVAAFNHVEGDLIQTTIINTYLTNRTGKGERFLDYVRRAGVDPFKEALYGPATARRPAAE